MLKMNKKNVFTLLLAILVLGSFLRVYRIGSESFWIDEMATVYTTQQNPSDIVGDIYLTTRHAPEYFEWGGTPPLFYVLANYWTKIAGLSEAKLRLLSAIFGVASIYLIFMIGKIIFDVKTGTISAMILSISYLHISYSQEARTYSLGVFLALLSSYFFLRALKDNKIIYWSAYSISSVLLVYNHYFGFLILLSQGIYLLFFWREYIKCWKQAAISYISMLALYLPWAPALMRQLSSANRSVAFDDNFLFSFAKTFVQHNSWLTPDFETRIALRGAYHSIKNFSVSSLFDATITGWLTIFFVIALTLFFAFCFIYSVFSTNKKSSLKSLNDKRHAFLLMWYFIPVLISLMLSTINPIFGYVRYTIFATPAYYLLVSRGISKFGKKASAVAFIIALSILPLYSYYYNYDKQQWREAVAYLENMRSNEIMVVNAPNNLLPLGHYMKNTDDVLGIKDADELKSAVKNQRIVWLLYASEAFYDPTLSIKKYLDENYELEDKKEFVGIKIYKYRK